MATLPGTTSAVGTITSGDDLVVSRLGYGTMRMIGQAFGGSSTDHAKALVVLRRAKKGELYERSERNARAN
jgi:hypothetical protein